MMVALKNLTKQFVNFTNDNDFLWKGEGKKGGWGGPWVPPGEENMTAVKRHVARRFYVSARPWSRGQRCTFFSATPAVSGYPKARARRGPGPPPINLPLVAPL